MIQDKTRDKTRLGMIKPDVMSQNKEKQDGKTRPARTGQEKNRGKSHQKQAGPKKTGLNETRQDTQGHAKTRQVTKGQEGESRAK